MYATLKLPTESMAEPPSGSSSLGEKNRLHSPPPSTADACLLTSLGLSAYIYSLDGVTTWSYLAFATSTFGNHSLIASIQTAQSIIGKSETILFPATSHRHWAFRSSRCRKTRHCEAFRRYFQAVRVSRHE